MNADCNIKWEKSQEKNVHNLESLRYTISVACGPLIHPNIMGFRSRALVLCLLTSWAIANPQVP